MKSGERHAEERTWLPQKTEEVQPVGSISWIDEFLCKLSIFQDGLILFYFFVYNFIFTIGEFVDLFIPGIVVGEFE